MRVTSGAPQRERSRGARAGGGHEAEKGNKQLKRTGNKREAKKKCGKGGGARLRGEDKCLVSKKGNVKRAERGTKGKTKNETLETGARKLFKVRKLVRVKVKNGVKKRHPRGGVKNRRKYYLSRRKKRRFRRSEKKKKKISQRGSLKCSEKPKRRKRRVGWVAKSAWKKGAAGGKKKEGEDRGRGGACAQRVK